MGDWSLIHQEDFAERCKTYALLLGSWFISAHPLPPDTRRGLLSWLFTPCLGCEQNGFPEKRQGVERHVVVAQSHLVDHTEMGRYRGFKHFHVYRAFSRLWASCHPWTTRSCLEIRTLYKGDSNGQESACNAKDLGSIPRSGRSPGEGKDNPLQYSCLGNSMDRGAWWSTVHGVP